MVKFVARPGIVVMMLEALGPPEQSTGTAETQIRYDSMPLSASENTPGQLTSMDAGIAIARPPAVLRSKGTSDAATAGGVGSHTNAVDEMGARSLPHALASTTDEYRTPADKPRRALVVQASVVALQALLEAAAESRSAQLPSAAQMLK